MNRGREAQQVIVSYLNSLAQAVMSDKSDIIEKFDKAETKDHPKEEIWLPHPNGESDKAKTTRTSSTWTSIVLIGCEEGVGGRGGIEKNYLIGS